jgi:hypothetical protein
MQIDLASLLEKQPVDTLTAYHGCLSVMANCAPLRFDELVSITPENAEVWRTMPDGSKRYGWRYTARRTITISEEAIILIPNKHVTLAKKAIIRLRELQSEMTMKSLKSLTSNKELRMNCSRFRRFYVDFEFRRTFIQ